MRCIGSCEMQSSKKSAKIMKQQPQTKVELTSLRYSMVLRHSKRFFHIIIVMMAITTRQARAKPMLLFAPQQNQDQLTSVEVAPGAVESDGSLLLIGEDEISHNQGLLRYLAMASKEEIEEIVDDNPQVQEELLNRIRNVVERRQAEGMNSMVSGSFYESQDFRGVQPPHQPHNKLGVPLRAAGVMPHSNPIEPTRIHWPQAQNKPPAQQVQAQMARIRPPHPPVSFDYDEDEDLHFHEHHLDPVEAERLAQLEQKLAKGAVKILKVGGGFKKKLAKKLKHLNKKKFKYARPLVDEANEALVSAVSDGGSDLFENKNHGAHFPGIHFNVKT